MYGMTVAEELRSMSGGGLTALAQHESVVNGIPVSVLIERPEVDRAGRAWRCRVRVVRGTGRIEHSQVVGTSAHEVLEQALDLAATRLGISESELLSGASMGLDTDSDR